MDQGLVLATGARLTELRSWTAAVTGTGLMTSELYQAHPPRYEYKLTPMGAALSPTIVALVRWSDEHLSTGRPATMLVHAPCGTELEQGFWCQSCATTFVPRRSAESAHQLILD